MRYALDGPSLFGLLTLATVLGLPAAGAIYTLFWGQP